MIIDDCVRAIWQSIESFHERVNLVHIGNRDQIDITTVGHLVTEVLELKNVAFSYTGGEKKGGGEIRSPTLFSAIA